MRREIFEQPDVLARVREREAARVRRLAERLRSGNVGVAVLAARGSSDHAAALGKYLIEWAAGVPAGLAAPSMATLYRSKLRLRGALVVGVSQSGRSPDVVEYLRMARRADAVTVAITNEPGSPLARAAEDTILCHAGPERSVAATKTFSAQLACLALLASAWGGGERGRVLDRGLAQAPVRLRRALSREAALRPIARRLAAAERCIVLARGFAYPAALETALKLKESAGIAAEGASAADFLHGPVAAADSGVAALLLATRGAALATLQEAADRLAASGASCLTVASGARVRGCALTVDAGAGWPEPLSALPLAALGQLTAYQLAALRGLDPDRPAGLTKVTRTW